jgi:hypothetical protein
LVKQPFAVVHAGKPNWLVNTARSLSAAGSSNASTIAIVSPPPALELVGKLYSDLTRLGEYPRGVAPKNGDPDGVVTHSAVQAA